MNKVYIYTTRDIGTNGWDVSELAHDISYTTSIDGQAGKLSMILEKDPNNLLQLEVGYAIAFEHDDEKVFYGYIFTLGTDRTEAYKVTAYDQTRYLQNHINYVVNGKTLLYTLFSFICKKEGLKFSKTGFYNHGYLPPKNFNDESEWNILNWALKTQNRNYDSLMYLRDRYGELQIKDVRANTGQNSTEETSQTEGYLTTITQTTRKNEALMIGDESLLTDYQYEISIDKNTYNEIVAVKDMETVDANGEKTKEKRYFDSVPKTGIPSPTIAKYGTLRKIVTVQDDSSAEAVENYLKTALEDYARPTKTLKIDAVGYDGLYAGDFFYLYLKKLGIKEGCFVISITHNYGADNHTMSMEVSTTNNTKEWFK